MFDAEHQTDSSYQMLLRLCGLSLELPRTSSTSAATSRPSPGA
ncbi:hypothetical protein HMPREF0682_2330 [Propionibacterium acidifaciens F0233]|uniref:Uncharacterized protein n=1 Tax=Propionibacterium acidifaciens F0233 TaxID=553198 RepID=U2Q1Q8_9ACTN|nr:hypothetical protein HMPREF0682_2330 [Propionibacterium acidifaciens F0233]